MSQDQRTLEDEASEALLRPTRGEWTVGDQARHEARLRSDPEYAAVYRKVEKVWSSLDAHAESPQLKRRRAEALAYANSLGSARQSVSKRWFQVAAACAALCIGAVVWLVTPASHRPESYRTEIGELRTLQLEDGSSISMDATTRLRVSYSPEERCIELQEGQAQFSVAHDAKRPFKVKAGARTIVALGTVFTVEFVDRHVRVAMMEGKVAVIDSQLPVSNAEPMPADAIQLSTGEELRISQAGRATLTPEADLEAATAWRDGKIIFRAESLHEAVRRLNRYSKTQIEIVDPVLAGEPISGVFEAGNTPRFVAALQQSLPIAVESADEARIRIRMR